MGAESLFFISMSMDGVFKVTVMGMSSSNVSDNMLLVETLWFSTFKIIDFNTKF